MNTKKAGATLRGGNAQRAIDMTHPRRYFTTTLEDTVNGVLRVIAWAGGLGSIVLAGAGVDGTADTRTVAGLGLIGLVLCLVGLLAGRMEERS